MSKESDSYKISDFNYITSAIGNAFFSGLKFEELWLCITLSKTREELDEAIEASIASSEKMKNIIEKGKNDE